MYHFSRLLAPLLLLVVVSGEEAFTGTCGGHKKGWIAKEDYRRWAEINVRKFPVDGWLLSLEVEPLVDRSETLAAHYCTDFRGRVDQPSQKFGAYAVCNPTNVTNPYDCITFVTYNDRMCSWASYCGLHQFQGDCSNIQNGRTFSCGNTPFYSDGNGEDGSIGGTGDLTDSSNATGGGNIDLSGGAAWSSESSAATSTQTTIATSILIGAAAAIVLL